MKYSIECMVSSKCSHLEWSFMFKFIWDPEARWENKMTSGNEFFFLLLLFKYHMLTEVQTQTQSTSNDSLHWYSGVPIK